MRNARFVRLFVGVSLLVPVALVQLGNAVPASAALPTPFVVDPAVNNTVANFATTDGQGGSEPSAALESG